MKKLIKKFYHFNEIVFTLLVVLVFANCEKPVISDNTGPDGYKGNLTINVFSIEQTPFSASTRAPGVDYCTRLNFAVYSLDGTRVKQVNQMDSEPGYGSASFLLSPGTYQVVVVGHSSNGNPTMANPHKIQFKNNQGFTDTFLYSGEVVVTDEHQDLSIELERIVALCKFVVTDDFPEDVAQLRFQYKGGSGAFDADTGLGSVNSTQTLFFDAASGQKEFDLYTFLHDTEGTIHLQVTAYDDSDNVLYDRLFDIPLQQKYITWFSGPYFTGGSSDSVSFTITINTEWEGESHLSFARAPVRVHFNDFSVTENDFARTRTPEDAADYAGVKVLTLAFYDADGKEVYNTTQLRGDATTYTTFGDFTCNLPIGSFTMVALGYGGTVPLTLTSPVLADYADERVRETFSKTQTVTISNTSPVDISTTLERIVSKVVIQSTDNLLAGVTKLNMTFAGGSKAFNPTTGLAATNTGFTNYMNISSTVGAPITLTSYLFLATDEQTMDITIETLDADNNVLFTKVVNNVPLRRNKVTTLTGSLFTAAANAVSFHLNTDWHDGNTIEF